MSDDDGRTEPVPAEEPTAPPATPPVAGIGSRLPRADAAGDVRPHQPRAEADQDG